MQKKLIIAVCIIFCQLIIPKMSMAHNDYTVVLPVYTQNSTTTPVTAVSNNAVAGVGRALYFQSTYLTEAQATTTGNATIVFALAVPLDTSTLGFYPSVLRVGDGVYFGPSQNYLVLAPPSGTPSTPIDSGAYSSSTTITLNWTVGSSSTDYYSLGIKGYYLQVGTTPGGNNKYNGDVGNVLTYNVSGCTQGSTYYARVRARDRAGAFTSYSDNSDGVKIDTTAPSIPAQVRDGSTTDITYTTSLTQLSANWDASTDAESGIVKYWYAIGTSAGGTDTTAGWIDNGASTSVTNSTLSLSQGQTYYFTVKAENGSGLQSSVRNSDGQKVDTTPPAGTPTIPTDAGIYSTSISIAFNWTAGISADLESGIAGYYLQVGTTQGGSDKFDAYVGNVLTYNIAGCLQGNTYYARVRTNNAIGLYGAFSGASDGIKIDTTPPTGTPTTPIDSGSSSYISTITFNWAQGTSADSESGITGYYLQVGTTPGGSDKFDGDVGTVLTYAVSGCSNGSTYYAKVKAKNGAGLYGGFSGNSDGLTIGLDVTPPTGIPSTPTSNAISYLSSISINWTAGTSVDVESGITGYYLQVGTTPGGTDKFVGDAGNVLTYSISGCNNGSTYYARVKAKNGVGLYSGYSGNSSGIIVSIDATPPTGIPSTPTSNTISYLSNIVFNWTQGTSADLQSGIDGYYLQVGTTPGGSDKFDGDVGNVLTYAVSGCSNGSYYAKVRAKNGSGLFGGYSGNSDGIIVSIDVTPPTGMPSTPSSNTTSSTSTITFSWAQGTTTDSESGITGYYLQVGTTPGGNDKFDGDVGNVLTYNINGCVLGSTYYAKVRAKNGSDLYGGYSGNSIGITIVSIQPVVLTPITKLIGNKFNPLKGSPVSIQYTIATEGYVKITVHKSNGEIIRTLLNTTKSAGSYSDINWDGKDDQGQVVSSGVYIVFIDAGSFKDKKRVIIAK